VGFNKALECRQKVEALPPPHLEPARILLKFDKSPDDQRKVIFEQRVDREDESVAEMSQICAAPSSRIVVTKHVPSTSMTRVGGVTGLRKS